MHTDIVAAECRANPLRHAHDAIRRALESKQLRLVEWAHAPGRAMWSLDHGDASTIALASASKAAVLVDDRAA